MTQSAAIGFTAVAIPHRSATSAAEIAGTGSSFFSAFRFLPAEKRRDLTVIYAFFRAADDCVDEPADATAQREALAYWRDQMRMAYTGKPAHPVMIGFADVVRRRSIPRDYFEGLIKGCEWDIEARRYENLAELKEYCYRVAGLVGLTCLNVFGWVSEESRRAAVDLGVACQITNIIRDIGEDYARGRVYLPAEMMRRRLCTDADLTRRDTSPALFAVLADLSATALRLYDTALPVFKRGGRPVAAATAMGLIYRRLLVKIHRQNYPVLIRRVRLVAWDKILALAPHLPGMVL